MLAVTAYRDEDTHNQAKKVGIMQVLGKPVFLNDLQDILSKYYYNDMKSLHDE